MDSKGSVFLLSIATVFVGIFYYYTTDSILDMCELEKCPFCYGIDQCELFQQNKITLKTDSFLTFIYNHISVKNVFSAKLGSDNVILKKLGHSAELSSLDKLVCSEISRDNFCNFSENPHSLNYTDKVITFLNNAIDFKNFKTCSEDTSVLFINSVLKTISNGVVNDTYMKNVWTILQVNVEPLMLRLLNADDTSWPVPQYLGACGRLIIESYCGQNLNHYADLKWERRAYLAYQLLQAANKFTYDHPDFRIYLTDFSPDNVAVDSKLKMRFVDLENVVLNLKTNGSRYVHVSEDFESKDSFVYSEQLLCKSAVSDHNFYSMCKLFLSLNAPWPMMKNGLLHSPPEMILKKYPELFEYINLCVTAQSNSSRLYIVTNIMKILKNVYLDK